MSDYSVTGNPISLSRGASSLIRVEFGLIQTAIATKVDNTGDTYTGTHDMTGATVTVAAPTTGSNPATKTYADALAMSAALPSQSIGFVISDGATASWSTTFTGFAANEVKGSNVASAGTINLTTATGNLVHVTGTTTITAITIPSGAERTAVFDGALTLTHHATTLILPGGANITTAAGDSMIVRGDGSGNARVVSYTRATGAPVAGFPMMKVSDQKSSGTSGGSTSAADITQTRVLNTVDNNTISGASLASNEVTLPAGTYTVSARATASAVGAHVAILYNTSDSANQIIGSTECTAAATNSASTISGQFTISASKNFKIRHFTTAAVASSGFGLPATAGVVEQYAELTFWKVA